MSGADLSRRSFLSAATALAGGAVLSRRTGLGLMAEETKADYSLRIATQPIELAPKRIVSVTAYNGQFPGPLLRFREGAAVTVDVHNDTDTPEQLHWHGQSIPSDVDGAAEEGTPFIPAPRQLADLVRTPSRRIPLLPYSRARRCGPQPGPVQRFGWSGLYRTEE